MRRRRHLCHGHQCRCDRRFATDVVDQCGIAVVTAVTVLLSTVQIQHKLPRIGLGIHGQGTLVGNGTRKQCRGYTKPSRNVTANVVQRPRIVVQPVLFNPDCCKLHAGINGGTHRTTQRVPNLVIEPLKESFPTIPVEILNGIRSYVEASIVWQRAIEMSENSTSH